MPSTADGDEPPTVTPALTVTVPDEAALTPLARRLVEALPPRAFVALEGDLVVEAHQLSSCTMATFEEQA